MIDENNNKLLDNLDKIVKELTFHAREGSTCRHSVAQFLEEIDFENE